MSLQIERKSKSWKKTKTPAWLAWIAVIYLVVGAGVMLWAADQAPRHPEIYPLSLLGYLAGFALIVLMAYIHGVLQLRKEEKSPKPITPKGFLKQCIKCGKEIPVASEVCAYCGAKQ